jgi:hypothetical protein
MELTMLTDAFVKFYGTTYDLPSLSQCNSEHCDILMYQSWALLGLSLIFYLFNEDNTNMKQLSRLAKSCLLPMN